MGKGGGALNMWIKEFTALVFTQTIQAFIYAMIITVILFGMVNTTGVSGDDNNAALGLMATFALLSVFKVEELAKKIFGISDTKASHGNAMKSIAKTAFAFQLGKRVLDNTGKVFGGIRKITKAGQDRRKTAERYKEDMQDYGFNRNGQYVGTGRNRSAAGGGGIDATMSLGGNAEGGSQSSEGVNVDFGQLDSYAAIGSGGGYELSASARRKIREAQRSYEDKLDEIKQSRNEGIKDIISGSTEMVGSVFGGVGGALLGGADGNFDEMFQGAVAGAGVGDAVAESVVNVTDRAIKFVQRNAKAQAGMSHKELKKVMDKYKKAIEDANINYASSSVDDIDI